jgi:hypothetical protein
MERQNSQVRFYQRQPSVRVTYSSFVDIMGRERRGLSNIYLTAIRTSNIQRFAS